ncbi:MAG TPA: UDP-3-O-(3-hydroxymyristoyl)glucosamine N-acyltransferase, partial [Flavobacteriales bacterium]|nr:UDP-3-O-(3-hydroxymyristoyl)glucosamine N-acyltransferase [Flavobacteriales bacterium]
ISEILAIYPVLKFTGNASAEIIELVELDLLAQTPQAIAWCNVKSLDKLNGITSGTVICPPLPASFEKKQAVNYLETDNPRLYFKNVLQLLFPAETNYVIAASAKIAPGVTLGKHVSVGEHAVIEKGCVIGEFTRIGHNTVLHKNTKVGNHVVIGCNNTIGGVGFGYEKNSEGQYEVLPHVGNVVIEDGVDIANNVCIDRAVLSSTLIKSNVKIDNHVHIAHNVVIGENALIIAHAMIGGSTVIGKNVWVAPSASILNKLVIGDNAFIGMGAVVIKNVKENERVVGNPARPIPDK